MHYLDFGILFWAPWGHSSKPLPLFSLPRSLCLWREVISNDCFILLSQTFHLYVSYTESLLSEDRTFSHLSKARPSCSIKLTPSVLLLLPASSNTRSASFPFRLLTCTSPSYANRQKQTTTLPEPGSGTTYCPTASQLTQMLSTVTIPLITTQSPLNIFLSDSCYK